MLSESVRFDETSSRYSHSDQPLPPGGVPRALRSACESAGLDPTAELYNESLRYATEGHLRLARERLTMLLCMAPDDGESRILLAKVYVAGQRWQEALAALDEASSCGQNVPMELRRAIEDHLHAEEASKEEEVTALRARDDGEVKALRQEARRLRSENANLVGRCSDLERETRKWAWTTAGVSSMAILFIIGNLIFGGGGEATPEQLAAASVVTDDGTEQIVSPEAPSEAPIPSQAGLPPQPPVTPVIERAAHALADTTLLAGSALEVEMKGDNAVLHGTALSHRQIREAERVLKKVKGVDDVDVTKVANTSRTKGSQHTVRKGDTLSHIAYEYYGESHRSKTILKANSKLLRGRATNLQIGQELRLPAVD
jgi:nucleoid-associated protein YgaU